MVAQEAPGGPQTLLDNVLEADTERAALLAESEGATNAGRIAEACPGLREPSGHGRRGARGHRV